jgi:hypothetical protein
VIHFLEEHQQELIEAVDSELSDWGLIGDIEDSDIEETHVTSVEVEEITSFGSVEKGSSILAVGRLRVTETISYTHPNWDDAIWDSEDKSLIPFDNVSRKTEISFDVDVSMSIAVHDSGHPYEIEELRFRNDAFQYVELHPDDTYN